MSDNKRGPGRPPGARNKVNIRNDVVRALKTGMSLTQLKDFIEEYLLKVASAGDHRNVIALIKQDVELVRYLHKMEIDFDNEDAKGDAADESENDQSFGEVLNFGRKSK